MKLIFVTGGVISGLGKGITAASIGRLLKSSGYTISMIKMDPYLQVDAGTMSPYEHGEVYVTDDGGEIDLDFGHYERFVGVDLSKKNSITTGKVFLEVINKERKGEYLGQTVQVIPHVINEIKTMVEEIATKTDVTIIEIGGTVGDIEGPHFIETIRQLRYELGVENTFFVHVVPVIRLTHNGEYKTKAIQHSIIKLREVGISPDALVVRTPEMLDDGVIAKLSLFGGIQKDRIIQAVDMDSIYKIPLMFHEQGISDTIQKQLFGNIKKTDLTERRGLCDRLTSPHSHVTIGIAGKYTHFDDCYLSVLESLRHAGVALDAKVKIVRIDTVDYEDTDWEQRLAQTIEKHGIQGILVPGGFGKRGVEGMINVASYAMQHKIPYMGICLGLQVAVIAHARQYCGLTDAHSTEFTQNSSHPVVHLMEHQRGIENLGGTMRLGSYPAVLQPGTKTHALYSKRYADSINDNIVQERHRHRYEVNQFYHDTLQSKGLTLSGLSPDGQLVEFIEIADHPYFLATQAHPEFLSQLDKAHPLFVGLVEASMGKNE